KVKDIKPSGGEKPSTLAKPLPSQEKTSQTPAGTAKPSRPDTGTVLPAPKADIPGREKPQVSEEKVVMEKGRFAWPFRGEVKTRFGIQPNKTYHNWIKIACPAGTRVKAAASGTVIFSANLKDFGETVIIRHANDFATVYTHLSKRSVRTDQDVGKGQTIGHAGKTDEAGETYFNFEIRIKGKARNPLFYLP
ncbi:MAG: peptidoglycan DD-metalloendopeptidase family protein, partial [Syntrophaceae bacterium]|nr:peptidoglycan DD-metalloendopeptidase family protein [Syntrophaceae bacterium]